MGRYHVYGVGNALVDMEYLIPEADLSIHGIEKGVMTLVDEQRHHELTGNLEALHHKRACGGSAANTVIALAQLGGKAYYSCKVGNDESGSFYLRDLRACGVESAALDHQRPPGVTGKCLVMVTPDADRTMNTYLGISSDLSVDDINPDAIADSDHVYLEGYLVTGDGSRKAAIETARIAREAGVPTALTLSDPNIVKFFNQGLLEMAGDDLDLLFCNEAEACIIAGTDSADNAVETLKSIAKRFAMTRGADGALLFDGDRLIEIAPHAVKPIDTNGAGDMYAGAFLYGITHGMDFSRAGELASLTSAHLVTHFGPRLPADKTRELLQSFVQQNIH
ncbi:MAG: adenosine kinase [Gammaproteobacteria bacterium]|nr:adenosine kinase [Gammaproteobacteria bacterium]